MKNFVIYLIVLSFAWQCSYTSEKLLFNTQGKTSDNTEERLAKQRMDELAISSSTKTSEKPSPLQITYFCLLPNELLKTVTHLLSKEKVLVEKVFVKCRTSKDTFSLMALNAKKDKIATENHCGAVTIWGLNGRLITVLPGNGNALNSIAFSSQDNTFVTAQDNGNIRIHDLRTDSFTEIFIPFSKKIESVYPTPDLKNLIIVYKNGAINSAVTDGRSKTKSIILSKILSDPATFNKDYSKLLAIKGNGDADLMSCEGLLLHTFMSAEKIRTAKFDTTGEKVVTMSKNGTAEVWNLDGTLLGSMVHEKSSKSPTEDVSAHFNETGDKIITLAWGEIKVWSLEGILLATIHASAAGNQNFFTDCQAHATRITAHCKDRTTQLWSMNGMLLATFPLRGILYNEKDHIIITQPDDQTLEISRIPTFDVPRECCLQLLEALRNTKSSFNVS